MNEEYIRQLAKNTFEEQLSEHLDSGIIFKYISDIENELQAYKDKEDKLREYIEKYNKVNAEKADTNADRVTMLINADDLLQILNEGDK